MLKTRISFAIFIHTSSVASGAIKWKRMQSWLRMFDSEKQTWTIRWRARHLSSCFSRFHPKIWQKTNIIQVCQWPKKRNVTVIGADRSGRSGCFSILSAFFTNKTSVLKKLYSSRVSELVVNASKVASTKRGLKGVTMWAFLRHPGNRRLGDTRPPHNGQTRPVGDPGAAH